MPIIEWNESVTVGVPEIDQHHQELVQSLNRAYDQFREGGAIDLSFLQELVDDSARHFACEEGWMKKTSYPQMAAHLKEHELFTARMLELQKNQRRDALFSVELLWFLCNWVTHHMRETDLELGQYLGGRQPRKTRASMQSACFG